MDYRPLGRTGVHVSRLCLGTMSFGSEADEAESTKMFAAALDLGINFIDTADQYSGGKSEEILGRLLKGKRDDLVVASKVFNPVGKDRNARGGSRRHIVRATEACLARLQTDRLDILYLHKLDPDTPIEESMRALEDLARAMGVPPAALQRTIDDWNAACAAGTPDSLGRPAATRQPIATPPYYYGEVWPVVSNTQGALCHDVRQRVLDPFGHPIPRLYVAGELGSIWGFLYLSGGNLSECLVSGRIAGREAASAH